MHDRLMKKGGQYTGKYLTHIKKVEMAEENKTMEDIQKTSSKMADVNPTLSVII